MITVEHLHEPTTLEDEALFGAETLNEMDARLGAVALEHEAQLNTEPVNTMRAIAAMAIINTVNSKFGDKPGIFTAQKADKSTASLPQINEVNDTAFADGYLEEMMAFKQDNFSDKFEVQAQEEARALQAERDDHMMIELMDKDRAENIDRVAKKRSSKKKFIYTDFS